MCAAPPVENRQLSARAARRAQLWGRYSHPVECAMRLNAQLISLTPDRAR